MNPSLEELERQFAQHLQNRDARSAANAAADMRLYFGRHEKGWVYGAMVLLMSGDAQSARALLTHFLDTHPATSAVLLQRAESELALGDRAAALQSALAARSLASSDPAGLQAVGHFLMFAGHYAAARDTCSLALEHTPSDAGLYLSRAKLNRFLGDFTAARADYDATLSLQPGHAEALRGRADLGRGAPRPEDERELRAALENSALSTEDRVGLHFALGQVLESMDRHAEAWSEFVAGNSLHRTQLRYDRALDAAVVDGLIDGFASKPTRTGSSTESPIFIVGLPRTGTTLAERILGSHPSVHPAGELSALSETLTSLAAQALPPEHMQWLDFVSVLPHLDPDSIAAGYLSRVQTWRGTKSRFTDKQPTNFYYCGSILAAFPQARIIHLTRHPLASIHSLFKAYFPRSYPFSYQLDELGAYYIGYRRLMQHWSQLYPEQILNVAYEDIVTALEPTVRRMTEFCGLPFDESCLDYASNPEPSTTASGVQVRQPLYDRSLELWRHYDSHLAATRALLVAAGIQVD